MSHLTKSICVAFLTAASLVLAGCSEDSGTTAMLSTTATSTVTDRPSAVRLKEGLDFTVCGRHAAAGTIVTSCPFSINVGRDYLSQTGSEVRSWSEPMQRWYDMYCKTGYSAEFANGDVVDAARCTGGINAVVIVFMY